MNIVATIYIVWMLSVSAIGIGGHYILEAVIKHFSH